MIRTALLSPVASLALALSACSGAPSGTGGNSGSGGSGGAGAAGGSGGAGGTSGCAAQCASNGIECGVHWIAGCGEADCGPCRFQLEVIGRATIIAAPDGSIHIAHIEGVDVSYAPVVAGALSPEQVATGVDGDGSHPGLAIAPDGAVYIAWAASQGAGSDSDIQLASRVAGSTTWQIQTLGTGQNRAEPRVFLDDANTPHATYRGTAYGELIHVTIDGATNPTETLTEVIGPIVVARSEAGAISVAYRWPPGIGVANLESGSLIKEATPPPLLVVPRADLVADIGAAFDANGDLHMVVGTGDPTFRTGTHGHYLVRSAGSWNVSELPGGNEAELATGPAGNIHMLRTGPRYSLLGGTTPAVAIAVGNCDEADHMGLAVDATDQPHLLFECATGPGTRYLTPAAAYPDGYLDACDEVLAAVCAGACQCGDPTVWPCCYGSAGGSWSCSSGQSVCESRARGDVCGDVTALPDPLLACRAAGPGGSSCAAAGDHYLLPTECEPVF